MAQIGAPLDHSFRTLAQPQSLIIPTFVCGYCGKFGGIVGSMFNQNFVYISRGYTGLSLLNDQWNEAGDKMWDHTLSVVRAANFP